MPPDAVRFPETSWTLLAKAREQCDGGDLAREAFAKRYYRPVRGFLMALVQNSEKAEDLSQEFFTRLSAPGGLLERATPCRGRFHSFLKQALRNLAIDHYRSERNERLKTHPDQVCDEGWNIPELAALPTADAALHYEWVKVTLLEALARVRIRCVEQEQHMHLDLFEKRYLNEGDVSPSWGELGDIYGISAKTARERADTVARNYRVVLRDMLRDEINVPGGGRVTEAMIDEEIRALLSPL